MGDITINGPSWKDRVPPDGHIAANYEIQICDEGNKVKAVQGLDKSGLTYRISARTGQFYVQVEDMETFTKMRHLLNDTMDMSKEGDWFDTPPKLTISPEVTPVGSNVSEEVESTENLVETVTYVAPTTEATETAVSGLSASQAYQAGHKAGFQSAQPPVAQ